MSNGEMSKTNETLDSCPLHTAIRNDNKSYIKYLLSKRVRIDCVDENNQTALHVAVSEGSDISIINVLLAQKASITKKDCQDRIPLHYAANNGHLKICELLLTLPNIENKLAYVNMRDFDSYTALHYAAKNGHTEIIKLLIKHGASVNMSLFPDGFTALHLAVMYKHETVVSELMNYKINVNSLTQCQNTALHLAMDLGRNQNVLKIYDIVGHLLKGGADLNMSNQWGRTPLHYAVKLKRTPLVQTLLRHGARVNAESHFGETALTIAVNNIKDFLELKDVLAERVIDVLLKAGADVNVICPCGFTPVHLAVKKDNADLVKKLVLYGADVNIPDNQGRTPLHTIASIDCSFEQFKLAEYGNFDLQLSRDKIVDTLLFEAKAKVDIPDNQQQTPLKLAVESMNFDLAFKLLICGADVNFQDSHGNTALHSAADQWDIENNSENIYVISKLLGCAHICIVQLQLLILLLEAGGNPNLRDNWGTIPLHDAVQFSKIALDKAEVLLLFGAEVNALDDEGKSALHYAVSWGDAFLVRFLLQNGADVSLVCGEGNMAIHHAASSLYSSVIHLLVEAGADVQSRTLAADNTAIIHFLENPPVLVDYLLGIYALLEHGANITIEDIVRNSNTFELVLQSEKSSVAQTVINAFVVMQSSNNSQFSQEEEEELGPLFLQYYTHSKLHLERLKCTLMWGKTTLYDILIKSDRQLTALVRNESLLYFMENYAFQAGLYANWLHYRICTARDKAKSCENCINVLRRFTKEKLPYEICEQIVNYLPAFDRHYLSLA